MTIATRRADVLNAIEAIGVVAVVRLKDGRHARALADALLQAGVSAIEITMTVPNAVEVIRDLNRSADSLLLVGAGTVTDAATARQVIEAGAQFVVSPIFKPEIVEACHRFDVPAMPGCFSPTEIFAAWEAGADIVKVFPAITVGPDFLKNVRGPLPDIRLMPSGGVTGENAGEWIKAGAVAISVSTALVDPVLVAGQRFDAIADRARHFVSAVRDARASMGGRA
jgi:2-dehydro-3-deoxyphosphogluconate aldolase/(4S)-4-hydroxy-2-oxoglutarate aldolase